MQSKFTEVAHSYTPEIVAYTISKGQYWRRPLKRNCPRYSCTRMFTIAEDVIQSGTLRLGDVWPRARGCRHHIANL